MLPELLLILALVLVNGLLAGAEIAVVGVDKLRLKQLVQKGSKRARAVQQLRASPERFFAIVQIGITVVGASAAALGGVNFANQLEPVFARLPLVGRFAESLSLVLVVAVISFLSLVLGELVPKSLAMRHAEKYALAMGPPVLWLSSAARPFVWFLTKCSNLLLGLFGDKTTFAETRISPEELQGMLEEATESGTLHPDAGEIASRALSFVEVTVLELMVPRSRVVAIPRTAPGDEIKEIVLEYGYSRLPVYGKDVDDILGYVLVKDMLAVAWERQLVVLEDLIRPPLFVSQVTRAPEVLKQMQEERVHLAIVVDEHGGTAGIVTIEDLLEELVGEITSELATPERESFRPQGDGSSIVLGETTLREVNRELDTELPDDESATIGGLCTALAGRVPHTGQQLEAPDGTSLQVESATPRAVLEVRVRPRPRPAQQDQSLH
ncbi:MAG TPA: hemolysin family protein [Polyangiaceae bacterium]|nr:hemolysin family protein [Polyangiaceae bacterium]